MPYHKKVNKKQRYNQNNRCAKKTIPDSTHNLIFRGETSEPTSYLRHFSPVLIAEMIDTSLVLAEQAMLVSDLLQGPAKTPPEIVALINDARAWRKAGEFEGSGEREMMRRLALIKLPTDPIA